VAGGALRLRVRARPLPAGAAAALEAAAHVVAALQRAPADAPLDAEMQELVDALHERLAAAADDAQARSCCASATVCNHTVTLSVFWRSLADASCA
jgi:hypothetical protein